MRTSIVLMLAFFVAVPSIHAQHPDRSEPPAVGPVHALKLPTIQPRTLSSGLSVWIVEKHQVPLVQMSMLVGAGRMYETPPEYGLADLTADMLDEGAGERSAVEISDALDLLGARFSIKSDEQSTTLNLRVQVDRADKALAIFSDILLRPIFSDADLDRLRLERLTELITRRDEPNVIASALLNRTLFGVEHPFGRTGIGDEAHLRRFTTVEMRAFYAAHCRPNNAVMVVVGDVTPESIIPLLEKAFGDWPSGNISQPAFAMADQVRGRRLYLVDKPGAVQSVIRIGRIGAKRDTKDYYAIEVLNTILGGSFTSRLNQNLREDKGYTYGASSAFVYRAVAGPFLAGASVQTAVTGPALTEFINELRNIRKPTPEAEIDRARNFLAMRFPAGFQSVSQVAIRMLTLRRYHLPLDTYAQYTQGIMAVTPADVARVARQYIDPCNIAIIVVGDRSIIGEQIKGLKLGPEKWLSLDAVLGAPPKL